MNKRRLDEISSKIKMNDIHDDCDDDIIELTEDELKETLADEDFDADYEAAPIPKYYFSNPDPYANRPDDAPKRENAVLRALSLYLAFFIERLLSKNTVYVD